MAPSNLLPGCSAVVISLYCNVIDDTYVLVLPMRVMTLDIWLFTTGILLRELKNGTQKLALHDHQDGLFKIDISVCF